MVNNTKRGMQQFLIQQLYRDDVLDDLLTEREEVVVQRKVLGEAVRTLKEAAKVRPAGNDLGWPFSPDPSPPLPHDLTGPRRGTRRAQRVCHGQRGQQLLTQFRLEPAAVFR